MKTSLGISSRRIFVGIALFSLTLAAHAAGYTFVTIAGSPANAGHVDATGSAAKFDGPDGIVADASGNIYVSDYSNHLIRKVTPAGVVTTFAGSGTPGSANGTGTAASFNFPGGLAIDASGNLYLADSANHTIRKITPGAVVTTLAGSAGQSGATNNTGSLARFNNPLGVAVDGSGNIVVADTANQTIRRITPGGVVTTIAGLAGSAGSANGTGTAARFTHPFGVAVDASGNNIFVADNGNHLIRKIAPGGVVTTLAGTAGVSGSTDGTGTAAQFNAPYSLTLDASGNVYVADYNNDTIRLVTPAGVVTTAAGLARTSGIADGIATVVRFSNPAAVTFDSDGNFYVADYNNDTIRRGSPPVSGDFDGDGITDILWRNTANGLESLWLMNPDLTVKAYIDIGVVAAYWQITGIGDFDGDGATDILWRNTADGTVGLWLMNQDLTVKTYIDIAAIPTDWVIAGTGDFDGDGHVDILWRNNVTGVVGLWLMNPDLTVKAYLTIGGVSPDWQIGGTGDFDGDGHVDVLWRNTANGLESLWLMNPDTTVKAYVDIGVVSADWQIRGTGDFDGDGHIDILWANTQTGVIGLWLMNPDLTVKEYLDIGVVAPDWEIAPQ
jgi:sugar lactone lactonase YvrE